MQIPIGFCANLSVCVCLGVCVCLSVGQYERTIRNIFKIKLYNVFLKEYIASYDEWT